MRAAAFVIVTLALFLAARPARATSVVGLCDDRGATAIAPPLELDAPDVAIARARTSRTCDADAFSALVAVTRGHHPSWHRAIAVERALPTGGTTVAPAAGEGLVPIAVAESPGRERRSRVERPPRV
jgi:hypothetical protein